MKFRVGHLALWHVGKRKLSREYDSFYGEVAFNTLEPYINALVEGGYAHVFSRPYSPGCGVPLIWELIHEHEHEFEDMWTVLGSKETFVYLFRSRADAIWLQMVMVDPED